MLAGLLHPQEARYPLAKSDTRSDSNYHRMSFVHNHCVR
jgi:hypothetical protein